LLNIVAGEFGDLSLADCPLRARAVRVLILASPVTRFFSLREEFARRRPQPATSEHLQTDL
jgi:hypothetical protein